MSSLSFRFLKSATYIVLAVALTLLTPTALAITNDGFHGNVIPQRSGTIILDAPGASMVNASSRNLFLSRNDLQIPGRGLPIEAILSYNSLTSGIHTSFGTRWRFNYDMSCHHQTNGNISVTWSDGRETSFRLVGGVYVASSQVLATLEQVSGSMLRLFTRQQISFFFDFPALGATTLLKSIRDPNGNAVTLTYNSSGQLTTVTDASGRNISLGYTGKVVTSVTDANASPTRTVHYAYAKGLLAKVTDALGNVTTYAYGSGNRIIQITDPLGITNISYVAGRPFGIVSSVSRSTFTGSVISARSFSYDNATSTATVTDRVNGTTTATTTYLFDLLHRMLQFTDPLGHVQTRAYGKYGNLTRITDANGNTSTFTYDSQGNVLTATDALTHTTSYTYDGIFNKVTSVSDPSGATTTFGYDGKGNLTSLQDSLGNTTHYSYDAVGQLTSRLNARGLATTFTYDSFGDITGISDPLSRAWSFTYDHVGNLVGSTDPMGHANTFFHDARNRLTRAIFPDLTEATFSWDPQDHLLEAVDPNTRLVFTYDAAGRPVQSTDNRLSKTISYQYDGISNRIQTTGPAGTITTYTYDLASRLTAIARNGHQFTFAYDAGDRLTQRNLPPGSFTAYAYDQADHLLSLVNHKSGGSVISSFTYQYDNRGNRTQLTYAAGDQIAYGYDSNGQLLSEVRTAGTANYNHQFSYDPVGNRLQFNADGVITNYTYDAADELTDAQTGTNHVLSSYDSLGNLVQTSSPAGVVSYSYDSRNRFAAFASPTSSASYAYDVLGRRTGKSAAGATTQFFYDGLNAVAEYDGSGVLRAQNLFGLSLDQIFARFASGGAFYYLQDGLNSVRNILDASQAVPNSYDYDAWGNILTAVENVSNDYTFTGRQLDRESSLYYYRARMYAPLTGRFTQTDLIDDNSGGSLYPYTQNSPVNFIDPLGTEDGPSNTGNGGCDRPRSPAPKAPPAKAHTKAELDAVIAEVIPEIKPNSSGTATTPATAGTTTTKESFIQVKAWVSDPHGTPNTAGGPCISLKF